MSEQIFIVDWIEERIQELDRVINYNQELMKRKQKVMRENTVSPLGSMLTSEEINDMIHIRAEAQIIVNSKKYLIEEVLIPTRNNYKIVKDIVKELTDELEGNTETSKGDVQET